MNIRTKLFFGIGALFVFVTITAIVSIMVVRILRDETQNILTANYNSVQYSLAMLQNLEKNDTTSRQVFSENLQKQENNITEKGEFELTNELRVSFNRMREGKSSENNFLLMKNNLFEIISMNMHAIENKSNKANKTAQSAVVWIVITSSCCFILTLTLLINIPPSIVKPIRLITDNIKSINENDYSHRIYYPVNNEYRDMIDSFNNMADTIEEYSSSTMGQLLMEKKRNESLISNFSDPIIGFDENGKVIFVNDRFKMIAGIFGTNVNEKSLNEIAERNDLIRSIKNSGLDIRNENKEENSIMKIYSDNKESHFEKDIVPIKITRVGEKTEQDGGFVCILKNVTAYKELDSAKNHLIATVSHEFKTPIASIKMSLQLLENSKLGLLNEEQNKLISGIHEDVERLLKITSELLTMTQVESGNIQLSMHEADPLEIVRYAAKATNIMAEQNNVQIEINTKGDIPKVLVDSEKTAWVITNLLSNAVRYSHNSSIVEILIETEDDKVKISVIDKGKGIAQEYLDRIFERYFKIPGTSKQGTGLGLAISKEFVEAQGGEIIAESELGVGSVFTLYLRKCA